MTVVMGTWCMRSRYRVAHLVESVIAGDAITACGRRMTDEPTSGGEIVVAPLDAAKCRQCLPSKEEP